MDRRQDDEKKEPTDGADVPSDGGARRSISSVDLEPYLKPAPICSLDTDESEPEDDERAKSGSPVKRPYMTSLSAEDVDLQMDRRSYAEKCRHLLHGGFLWRQQSMSLNSGSNKNLIDDDDKQSDEASTAPVESRSDLDASLASDIEPSSAPTAYSLMQVPETWEPRQTPEPPSYVDALRLERMEIEEEPPEEKETDCSMFGPLSGFCSTLDRYIRRFSSPKRIAILVIVLILVVGFALMAVLIPTSFVALEFNLIALERNEITGSVDRSRVYYPGCYLLTPSSEFVEYRGTVHNVIQTVEVVTTDELAIQLAFSLQYFIKPEELGMLHEKFDLDYEEPVEFTITSTIKNIATQYSVDDFRRRRVDLQEVLARGLRTRLGGNCCPGCCPSSCKNSTACRICEKPSTCTPAYHIDVLFFNLDAIHPPAEVEERYMRGLLLQIQEEREQFIQDKALVDKQTKREKDQYLNSAQEVLSKAKAESKLIGAVAAAKKERDVQLSYVNTLKTFYNKLNINDEDHKLSMMMIRNLEDAKNLYHPSYNFQKQTLANPS